MAWLASTQSDLNRATRYAKGAVLVDGKHIGDTLQCIHCSGHWIHQTGSGARRGWCMNCKGPTCGSARCDACIPLEMRLQGYEQGKTKSQLQTELDSMPFTIV